MNDPKIVIRLDSLASEASHVCRNCNSNQQLFELDSFVNLIDSQFLGLKWKSNDNHTLAVFMYDIAGDLQQ